MSMKGDEGIVLIQTFVLKVVWDKNIFFFQVLFFQVYFA